MPCEEMLEHTPQQTRSTDTFWHSDDDASVFVRCLNFCYFVINFSIISKENFALFSSSSSSSHGTFLFCLSLFYVFHVQIVCSVRGREREKLIRRKMWHRAKEVVKTTNGVTRWLVIRWNFLHQHQGDEDGLERNAPESSCELCNKTSSYYDFFCCSKLYFHAIVWWIPMQCVQVSHQIICNKRQTTIKQGFPSQKYREHYKMPYGLNGFRNLKMSNVQKKHIPWATAERSIFSLLKLTRRQNPEIVPLHITA